MIYIGPLIVSSKTIKDTVKGSVYELTAEDHDGNKLKLKFRAENFSQFKAFSIGDPIDPKTITWQSVVVEEADT